MRAFDIAGGVAIGLVAGFLICLSVLPRQADRSDNLQTAAIRELANSLIVYKQNLKPITITKVKAVHDTVYVDSSFVETACIDTMLYSSPIENPDTSIAYGRLYTCYFPKPFDYFNVYFEPEPLPYRVQFIQVDKPVAVYKTSFWSRLEAFGAGALAGYLADKAIK